MTFVVLSALAILLARLIFRGLKLSFDALVILGIFWSVSLFSPQQSLADIPERVTEVGQVIAETLDDGTQILYRLQDGYLFDMSFVKNGKKLGGLDLSAIRLLPAASPALSSPTLKRLPLEKQVRSGQIDVVVSKNEVQPIMITQIAKGETLTVKTSNRNVFLELKTPPAEGSRLLHRNTGIVSYVINSEKGVAWVEVKGPFTGNVDITLSKETSLAQTQRVSPEDKQRICTAKQQGTISKQDYFPVSEYPSSAEIAGAKTEKEKQEIRDILKEREAQMQVWEECSSQPTQES